MLTMSVLRILEMIILMMRSHCLMLFLFLSLGVKGILCQTGGGDGRSGSAPNVKIDVRPVTLSYDVVSIRRINVSQLRTVIVKTEDPAHLARFNATAATVVNLMIRAYGLNRSQISGIQSWMDNDLFDVQAKSGNETDVALAQLDDDTAKAAKQGMLQQVLRDRFHLTMHWSESEGNLWAMTLPKGTAKLSATGLSDESATDPDETGDVKGPLLQSQGGPRGLHVTIRKGSMEYLATVLSVYINSPVIDKTGVAGNFTFEFSFSNGDFETLLPDGDDGTRSGGANARNATYPNIYTALNEQLGIKLIRRKGKIKNLVIDRLDRPTEN